MTRKIYTLRRGPSSTNIPHGVTFNFVLLQGSPSLFTEGPT
uniref:Uncharacterized protein n=1 Tax=Anguilla anguilla TaxID=7936 RepID=A0A0E9WAR3_ANGAN